MSGLSASYIETVLGDKLYIPGIYQETFDLSIEEPKQLGEGNLGFFKTKSDKIVGQWKTRGNLKSNEQFWKIYGYLKSRAWVAEKVFVERLGTTVEAYVRIDKITSKLKGTHRNRKELMITVKQK